jgi:predicted RNA-binding Zn-ribbon protein involved in translation (DUF1610 family)
MKMLKINPDFMAPCGLYCGVCAIYIADRDHNIKFKERLVSVYKGEIAGKGTLPDSQGLSVEDIHCQGCLSDEPFGHCQKCEIRACTKKKGYTGCHECDEFPCQHIENFPMTVGKKVMMRAIPHWREVGTEQWIQDEENRYICPECGNKLFRGVVRCNQCKTQLDLD